MSQTAVFVLQLEIFVGRGLAPAVLVRFDQSVRIRADNIRPYGVDKICLIRRTNDYVVGIDVPDDPLH